MHKAISFLAVSSLVFACASQSTGPAVASSAAPLDVLRQGGSFTFSLDESTNRSAFFHAKCATSSSGDQAKADACYAEIADAGAKEGIRFSTDASGRLVWTSYGAEDGAEQIYLEASLDAVNDGAHGVNATVAAPMHGTMAATHAPRVGKVLQIEVVDRDTVAMIETEKGRLVYHRTK
jgi:hypothetical protein